MNATQLDAVEIKASPDGQRVRIEATIPADLDVIGTFLDMFEVNDLDVITAGVRAETGFGTDYANVSYRDGAVDIRLLNESESAPADAFDRFIARLVHASMDAAARGEAAACREPWWSKAHEDANAIITRAYPDGL